MLGREEEWTVSQARQNPNSYSVIQKHTHLQESRYMSNQSCHDTSVETLGLAAVKIAKLPKIAYIFVQLFKLHSKLHIARVPTTCQICQTKLQISALLQRVAAVRAVAAPTTQVFYTWLSRNHRYSITASMKSAESILGMCCSPFTLECGAAVVICFIYVFL